MKLPIAVLLLALTTAATAAESPPAGISVVPAGYAFRPDPQDYYPSISREEKEEGLTKIKLCYDLDGIPADVTLDESSGFTRLDEAALRYGRAMRIRPGRIDGQPQPGCVTVPVRFVPRRSPAPSEQGEKLPPPDVPVPPILKDIPLPPPPPIRIPLAPSPPDRSIAL
jgi:TonB family protein